MTSSPLQAGVTEPEVFFGRRTFLRAATCSLLAPAACVEQQPSGPDAARILASPRAWPEGFTCVRSTTHAVPAGIRPDLTPRIAAAMHNNFYEFLVGRAGPVWKSCGGFEVDPWTVEVGGLCRKPVTLDLDDLARIPHEERPSHFRCVERWAMNVPWCGFPLRRILERVEPTAEARYVRFFTANRPEQMPGLRATQGGRYAWPYHEALRLDEAMHDLALVATGVYGEPLLRQHGAPVRLIVPWKYGYKSPKSIVRIELVAAPPPTFWSRHPSGHEYGFLSNVNPNIPHPRWSQSESWWLDTEERFPTEIFNGYGPQVGRLYPDEPTTPQKPLLPGERAR